MPTRTKDYPLYIYDEPAIYRDFTGGINSDPSNEHLLDNEMRDCVNMTYLSGALVKRKGAKKLCDISCDEDLHNIQGIFLFTYRITYIIIAADGKLFKGIYNDGAQITLSRLFIYRTTENVNSLFNESDAFAGVEEKQPSEIATSTNHEGYIQTYYRDTTTLIDYVKNERGDYNNVIGGAINVGDVFTRTNGLYETKYLCIKSFEKTVDYPDKSNKWVLNNGDGLTFSYYDGENHTVNVNELTDEMIINLSRFNLYKFNINDLRQWQTNMYCLYNNKIYICVNPHYNRAGSLLDEKLFVDVTNLTYTKYVENKYLLFQNYRKVEAATINNKLYIATGTRIVEVSLKDNELFAQPVEPYLCNYTELTKIGYNYMSPYPEQAVASQKDTVTTSMSAIKVEKTLAGSFKLTPVMNIQIGDSVNNYYYRWEKLINGTWYVIVPFQSQKTYITGEDGKITIEKKDYSSIEVSDADEYMYRCTFAKSFELEDAIVSEWSPLDDYTLGNFVSVGAHIYKCLRSHSHSEYTYLNNKFSLEATHEIQVQQENGETVTKQETVILWEEIHSLEQLPYMYMTTDEQNKEQQVLTTIYDYIVDKLAGDYYGSATSVLFNNDMAINDTFLLIHSCTKVLADGNKLLFYGDRFNSGQWFKTIINNPGYITDRGSLSFKTTKNESLIKVIPFQGNLIAFANADNVGGSIHLIQGNGDDYDDQSGYYSPYQRRTINASITASNPDSIQICDNYLIFKYFNRVYYINASDLSNDTVKVTPCNDRLLNNEGEVQIPWDDDDCVSEVTNTYYALLWKEKYMIDEFGELVQIHPGIRVKLYYKMSVQYTDNNYGMPWLRDESDVFNVKHIIYIKGKPIYLYNNVLLSLDENYYKDIDKDFTCTIHNKASDLNYESFLKLIENVDVSFHRNQFNKVDIDVIIKNEAGHILLDTTSKRYAANDLGALFVGKKLDKDEMHRVGTTIQDHKLFLTINKFPCLLADTTIKVKTEGSFTLSSLTYMYTSIDAPDTNPSEIYKNIIRP